MKFKDLKKHIGTAVLAVLFSFSLNGCLDLTSTSETACPVTIVTSEEEISTETASPEDASPATEVMPLQVMLLHLPSLQTQIQTL